MGLFLCFVVLLIVRCNAAKLVDEPRPCFCTEEYKPVCGSDGTTYGNKCTAGCAGVQISSSGACSRSKREQPVTCECPMDYNPVCGSDGKTHANQCGAECSGATVASQGPCALKVLNV